MLFCGQILPVAELTIWDQTACIPAGKLSVTKAKVTRLYQSCKPPLMHVLQEPNMEDRTHMTNGQFPDTRDIWLLLNFGGKSSECGISKTASPAQPVYTILKDIYKAHTVIISHLGESKTVISLERWIFASEFWTTVSL